MKNEFQVREIIYSPDSQTLLVSFSFQALESRLGELLPVFHQTPKRQPIPLLLHIRIQKLWTNEANEMRIQVLISN